MLSATLYPRVLECLLEMPGEHGSLFVVDERGKLLGAISRRVLAPDQRRPLAPPVETATAADLSEPAAMVVASADRAIILRALRSAAELAVVDDDSVLLGVIRRDQGEPANPLGPRSAGERRE